MTTPFPNLYLGKVSKQLMVNFSREKIWSSKRQLNSHKIPDPNNTTKKKLQTLMAAGGKDAARHLGERCLNPPYFNTRATNSISYESWDIQLKFDTLLRLLRLKLQPREVAEVARVQEKKVRSKILKSSIFELHKRYIPQKKAENNCHLDLK